MAVAPVSSILQRLRQATHTVHVSLETRLDLFKRVHSDQSYRALLEYFYSLHIPFESLIQGADSEISPWLPDIKSRTRMDALRRDLGVLGNALPNEIPLATIPSLRTTAELFGCLYVLEGSTLGGQVIARHIRETLHYTAENGCAFFSGYGLSGNGSGVGEMWVKFRAGIEAYSAAHPENHDEIVAAATKTFETFEQWIPRGQ